jgi:hypothetical protein
LSTAEAREMLAHRLGTRRVVAEPQVVDDVITLCARLPLALAIAAVARRSFGERKEPTRLGVGVVVRKRRRYDGATGRSAIGHPAYVE